MDSDIEKEQLFRYIYYNSKTGFQSAERLYQKGLEDDVNVIRKEVKQWLKLQDTYTQYKPIRRHKFMQIDVVDMGKYKNAK